MTIRPDTVPMPRALAARPRDARGYPIPAITPWSGGQPHFAEQSSIRTLICLMERRCAVCGTAMARGPVWRMVDGDTAEAVALSLETGKPLIQAAAAAEGPGHRACMIYSAMVCPHLTSPHARRSRETTLALTELPKGLPRGQSAGIAAFDSYRFQLTALGVEIYFGQPVELVTYEQGEQLRAELEAELAHDHRAPQPCPAYLLDDDDAARTTLARLVRAERDGWTPAANRRLERARKDRRRADKAARRKNR